MESTNGQKYIYYFVRYTLLFGYPVLLLLAIAMVIDNVLLETNLPSYISNIIILLLGIPCLLAFGILRGIIYEDSDKGFWNDISSDHYRYWFYCPLTLGLGPAYIFFKKYDPMLRKYFKEQKGKKT